MADSDCIIVHEQVVVPDAAVVEEMVALPGEKEIKETLLPTTILRRSKSPIFNALRQRRRKSPIKLLKMPIKRPRI